MATSACCLPWPPTVSCVAAKDISMAGLVGSLAMLLEFRQLGVTVDLAALPRPTGCGMGAWLTTFPCFGFLLCSPAGRGRRLHAPFHERGLAAAVVGWSTTRAWSGSASGARCTDRDVTATVFDLRARRA